jgi:hypothetical protein
MDELFAKLTNLTYELFGILIPGIVMALFTVVWWFALGELVPFFFAASFDAKQLSLNDLPTILADCVTVPWVILLLPVSYFLGHFLHWIARSGPTLKPDERFKHVLRVVNCIWFRIPKPAQSFDPKLDRIFTKAASSFCSESESLDWREFYPIAKSFVSQRLNHSLVATYQTKYTFHRTLTTAAALLFWLTVAGLIVGGFLGYFLNVQPNYFALAILCIIALVSMWGFSGSYMLYWEMFGNTIVTETYCLIYGPKTNASHD